MVGSNIKLVHRDSLSASNLSHWYRGRSGCRLWKGRFGAVFAGWIMRQHNLDFNTKNALSKENVANGSIDILLGGVAAVDHQPVNELHRLGSLPSKFSGNDHLATLGARLH